MDDLFELTDGFLTRICFARFSCIYSFLRREVRNPLIESTRCLCISEAAVPNVSLYCSMSDGRSEDTKRSGPSHLMNLDRLGYVSCFSLSGSVGMYSFTASLRLISLYVAVSALRVSCVCVTIEYSL